MIYKISPYTFVLIDNQTLTGKGIKLKQGSFVKGEITKILENNKLIIKIQNREIIAETNFLKFNEGEKVIFWIKKVTPEIVLQTVSKKVNKLDKFINFLIEEFGENAIKKAVFNPLVKNMEREFKKIIKDKPLITKIIRKTKKELIELIDRDIKEYLFPVYVENKIYILRFKAKKQEEKDSLTIYFSIETETMGTIEIEINKTNQKLMIIIFVDNNKIAQYIQAYAPILKKIIDKYYKINYIAVKLKEKEIFHKEIELIA